MIDDIELPQVQELGTYERRMLAEHKPPAMSGSLLQNLGRRPTRIVLWGVATDPDALALIQKLDAKFRDGKPVSFSADIIADAAIDRMVIDDLRLQELAGKPARFAYVLTLREFITPLEPDTATLDTAIAGDATGLMNGILGGLNIAQAFASGLQRFIPTFTNVLGRLQQVKP